MKIQLSEHFDYKKLFKFTFPSVVMMVFISIYGVVDGFFVSNFVGKTPFAAVNFIMPFLMILGTVGFMFGTGGSAIIAKTMGEGNNKKARAIFSMLVYVSLALGIVISALGLVFIKPVAELLGAEGELLKNCVTYGRIILLSVPALIMQFEFQAFFITAEKPQLGLVMTVIAGVTNIVLDALFVAVFKWGLVGAAWATATSQLAGGIFPLIYFSFKNTSLLRLEKPIFDFAALIKTCTNGASEFVNNISMSVVGMLYNVQLIKYAGENGVAAYGVIMYVNLLFLSVFIGYSIGVAPIISYHFGAKNQSEIKSVKSKSIVIILASSVAMFLFAFLLAKPISTIFVSYDKQLFDMTVSAFKTYSLSFLFAGVAIFGSSYFTALNDGLTSAIISFLRTLVFEVAAVLVFPIVWGITGIWASIVAAEALAVLVTVTFFKIKAKKEKL